jgi:beta-lactamase class A
VRQGQLEHTLASAPEGVSVVVTRVDDGLHAEVHPDELFYAASLFKLAVLYEAERQRSNGELDFATTIYPDFSEDLGTSGELPLGEDGSIAIADALYYMITVSDNASAVGLMRFLGSGRIDETLRALGIVNTSVNTEELPATASDMARLMLAIVTGEGVDSEARGHMRELLMAQSHRFGVPASVPAGITVGNKTGTWDGALHDVAFVETRFGTYVIAVLTDGSLGWEGVAEWSLRVFEVLGGK